MCCSHVKSNVITLPQLRDISDKGADVLTFFTTVEEGTACRPENLKSMIRVHAALIALETHQYESMSCREEEKSGFEDQSDYVEWHPKLRFLTGTGLKHESHETDFFQSISQVEVSAHGGDLRVIDKTQWKPFICIGPSSSHPELFLQVLRSNCVSCCWLLHSLYVAHFDCGSNWHWLIFLFSQTCLEMGPLRTDAQDVGFFHLCPAWTDSSTVRVYNIIQSWEYSLILT